MNKTALRESIKEKLIIKFNEAKQLYKDYIIYAHHFGESVKKCKSDKEEYDLEIKLLKHKRELDKDKIRLYNDIYKLKNTLDDNSTDKQSDTIMKNVNKSIKEKWKDNPTDKKSIYYMEEINTTFLMFFLHTGVERQMFNTDDLNKLKTLNDIKERAKRIQAQLGVPGSNK